MAMRTQNIVEGGDDLGEGRGMLVYAADCPVQRTPTGTYPTHPVYQPRGTQQWHSGDSASKGGYLEVSHLEKAHREVGTQRLYVGGTNTRPVCTTCWALPGPGEA